MKHKRLLPKAKSRNTFLKSVLRRETTPAKFGLIGLVNLAYLTMLGQVCLGSIRLSLIIFTIFSKKNG
jgi:hypothetical protein